MHAFVLKCVHIASHHTSHFKSSKSQWKWIADNSQNLIDVRPFQGDICKLLVPSGVQVRWPWLVSPPPPCDAYCRLTISGVWGGFTVVSTEGVYWLRPLGKAAFITLLLHVYTGILSSQVSRIYCFYNNYSLCRSAEASFKISLPYPPMKTRI